MKAKVSNLEISQRETPNHPSMPQNPDQPELLQGHLKKKKKKKKSDVKIDVRRMTVSKNDAKRPLLQTPQIIVHLKPM